MPQYLLRAYLSKSAVQSIARTGLEAPHNSHISAKFSLPPKDGLLSRHGKLYGHLPRDMLYFPNRTCAG